MYEKTLSTTKIYDGRIIKVRNDEVLLDTGNVSQREICEHPGAVAVAAVTDDKKLVLIRQFRKPTEKVLIEIPAGLFNKGEKLEEAALRELKEETGFVAKKISHTLSIYTSPGYSTELLHIFIASNLIKGAQACEDDENIDVFTLSFDEVFEKIKNGEISDGKTIVAFFAVQSLWK